MGFGLRGGRINKKRPPISRRLFGGNLKDLYQPGCRGQAQGLRLSARPAGSLRGSSSFDQEVPGASSSPPGCWFVERYAINTWVEASAGKRLALAGGHFRNEEAGAGICGRSR
jgi:hypothetical protein